MLTLLPVLQVLAVVALFWLLPKYLESRVTAAAKGAVDKSVGKALADYKLPLDKELHRFSQDYALYAEKRNEVYAKTFELLERAIGAFSAHYSVFTETRDFRRSSKHELSLVAATLEFISVGERQELTRLLEADEVARAGALATKLYKRNGLGQASVAFREFRNATVLNALYFTPTIHDLLGEAVQALVPLTVYAEEQLDGEQLSYRVAVEDMGKARAAAHQVRDAMRAEMQASSIPANREADVRSSN